MCCDEQSSRLADTELSVTQSNDNNSNIVSKMSSVMKVSHTVHRILYFFDKPYCNTYTCRILQDLQLVQL